MEIKQQDKRKTKTQPLAALPIVALNEWEMSQIKAAGIMPTGFWEGNTETA